MTDDDELPPAPLWMRQGALTRGRPGRTWHLTDTGERALAGPPRDPRARPATAGQISDADWQVRAHAAAADYPAPHDA